ncbi:MAG: hypothetical protein K1X53_10650 [Candidatus Sumerlaeaceae bacterium]|nr:hypothetical protein [Candidatus Sumerlaeaceae bacterium]
MTRFSTRIAALCCAALAISSASQAQRPVKNKAPKITPVPVVQPAASTDAAVAGSTTTTFAQVMQTSQSAPTPANIMPSPAAPPAPLTEAQLDDLFFPKQASPDTQHSFALTFNGFRRSTLDPCGCVSHQLGGLDKEAQLYERLDAKKIPSIRVDAGGFVRESPSNVALTRSRYLMQGLAALKMDVINVASTDMQGGIPYLKELQTSNSLTFVSANIVDQTSEPLFAAYQIVPVQLASGDTVRVGVIGVTAQRPLLKGPAAGKPASSLDGTYTITDPAEALKKHLPELRKKADIVVALIYDNRENAKVLLSSLGADSGINFAVNGENMAPNAAMETLPGDVRLVSGGFEGRQSGQIIATVKDKKLVAAANQYIEIVQTIPVVPPITKIVEAAKQAVLAPIPGQ